MLEVLIGLGLVVGGFVFYHRRQQAIDRELRARPFPPEWQGYLETNAPLYVKLPEPLKQELHGHIHVFLEHKRFEGCGGLEVTDEMRVTVAGLACLLLLNRPSKSYPDLKTILIYPSAFVVESKRREGYVELADERQVRLGESWVDGVVVLSWDDVARSSHDVRDGHNLVLHEFAHQLDQEDGSSDGVPILGCNSRYVAWAQVFSKDYQKLRERTEKGKKSVLDAYGATNPAEFFAVATETFFEKPRQLKKKYPDLYDELKSFYQLDPLSWR